MFKRCKVVQLPTDKVENALRGYSDKSLLFEYQKKYNLIKGEEKYTNYFHLYILSDDEIKEGDWYVLLPEQQVKQAKNNLPPFHEWKKIIATTDSSLSIENKLPLTEGRSWTLLPSIPQSFIDKYINEYNKGNKIEEVMVEYDYIYDTQGQRNVLKLNSDNTINIQLIKDSWTREEVKELCRKAYDEGRTAVLRTTIPFNQWLEEKL